MTFAHTEGWEALRECLLVNTCPQLQFNKSFSNLHTQADITDSLSHFQLSGGFERVNSQSMLIEVLSCFIEQTVWQVPEIKQLTLKVIFTSMF